MRKFFIVCYILLFINMNGLYTQAQVVDYKQEITNIKNEITNLKIENINLTKQNKELQEQ